MVNPSPGGFDARLANSLFSNKDGLQMDHEAGLSNALLLAAAAEDKEQAALQAVAAAELLAEEATTQRNTAAAVACASLALSAYLQFQAQDVALVCGFL